MTAKADGKFHEMDTTTRADIHVGAITTLRNRATASAVSLDLSDGSINIAYNLSGLMLFVQNDIYYPTTGNSAIVRQSSTGTATDNTITIKSGEVNLTIADLNVESKTSPISVEQGASLMMHLVGSSTLKSKNSEGVCISKGATLTIQGSGSISAAGGDYGAGIGGSGSSGGTITINNGIVTATGGYGGAGIGGSGGGDGGGITITGGTVTATGGYDGAGIGGGIWGSGGTITINGGNVTATGGYGSAGIGGGYSGDGGTIKINGGTVTATSGTGAGIGGGEYSDGGDYCGGGTVYIEGADVSIIGRYVGIGGGANSNQYGCDNITILDSATVTVQCASDDEWYQSRFVPYLERIDYTTPLPQAALSGNSAAFSVTASGHSGLSYQWQSSSDGETWSNVDGQTAANASIPMSADNDGNYYRCRLTNGWGNVVYTDAAQGYVLAFTQQPTDAEINLNGVASLTVASSCGNVTYQWQRSYDNGASWRDVEGEIYSTLIVNATLSENDALYRCVIAADNGDTLASESARIIVQSSATTYTVNYYLETADGSGYMLFERSVVEAGAGASVTAPVKSYEHFTENTAKAVASGTVQADNSLVLARYYDRNSYTISYDVNGGAALSPLTAKYGAAVALPEPTRIGYTFDGWFTDASLTEVAAIETMPGENRTIYAKWTAVGAGRGIEYVINGITLRDCAYQTVDTIPTDFFYAEVSVTNLSSITTDTLLLATYDRDGKMLHTYFLYANPQIGQAFVLGAGIDNSTGSIARIKAFMLPAMGGIVPLAEEAGVSG